MEVKAQQTPKVEIKQEEKTLESQWKGKHVAFLGDSMTDKKRVGTSYIYWEYLTELLGIQPYVYGINGNQWDGIYKQANKLYEERKDSIDAILIFAGTNDYNRGLPLGTFYTESEKSTNHNGEQVKRKYREAIMDGGTFCGRINMVLSFLKDHFPKQQIVILTPIHRGYAKFGDKNVQPEERFANGQGLYIDDYVAALKQAGSYWSVPVIDLFSLSGLYPLSASQSDYFHHPQTDLLHPNANGNYRLAKTIQYQLLSLPAGFK